MANEMTFLIIVVSRVGLAKVIWIMSFISIIEIAMIIVKLHP